MLTALLALLHQKTRTPSADDELIINNESIKISDIKMLPVTGAVTNGKGEKTEINAQGVLLSEICGGDFNTVTVTASDEYSAVIKPEDSDNAYLISTGDNSLRLIVFGDENAKRDVKNVVRINFE